MAETRQQLKERLQAAGLWHEFVALRDRLAAGGLVPAQARAEGLRQVGARPARPPAPPPPGGPAGPSPAEAVEPAATPADDWPDFTRSVPPHDAAQWVAENIANPRVRPHDAPSGLAWGLLQWVRLAPANQTTFWGSIWPKL